MRFFPTGKAVALFLSALISIETLGQKGSEDPDKQALLDIERILNEADASHDANRASRYLDSDYRVKNHWDSKMHGKSYALDVMRNEAKTKPKEAEPKLDEVNVRVSGSTALVTFKYTVALDLLKPPLVCHMKDFFLKRADGWKLNRRTGTCP